MIGGNCDCEACLEDATHPPSDYVSHKDRMLDMAWDACWQDMGDFV